MGATMVTRRRLALLLLFATALPAQAPSGSWLVGNPQNGSGGMWLLDPTRTNLVLPPPQSAPMSWCDPVAADGNGELWYGTVADIQGPNPNEVFFVIVSGGGVVFEQRLTGGPIPAIGVNDQMSALTLHGGRLWFAMLDGRIGSLDPYTAGQTPVFAPNVPLPVGQLVNAMTSDGRELFVATWESNYNAGPTVYALDPAAPSPGWRSIADTHTGAWAEQSSAMTLGPDGDLLVVAFDGVLRRIDVRSGLVTPLVGPFGPLNAVSYDPWTGLAAFVEYPRTIRFYDFATSTLLPNPAIGSHPVVTGVAAVVDQPFLRFGRGCAGATAEPRMAWSGVPVAGGTASVGLVDGTIGGSAFLVFGFSNTTSVLGPLPLAGGQFGAPGCDLLVSPDAVAFAATPLGTASRALSLPNSPVVQGLVLHAQWLVGARSTRSGSSPAKA